MESTVWKFTIDSIKRIFMKRIWKLQYEFANARINRITWYHYSSWFIHFWAFKIWYRKKQHMYCFLPFGFIKVIIFVINPSGSNSTFVGVDLEYPSFLCYDRSSWSELRYFNFEVWNRFNEFYNIMSSVLEANNF